MTFAEIQRACCLEWPLLWKTFWIGLCSLPHFSFHFNSSFPPFAYIVIFAESEGSFLSLCLASSRKLLLLLSTPLINCLVFICLHTGFPWKLSFLNLRNENYPQWYRWVFAKALHNTCLFYGNILPDTQECICLCHTGGPQSSCDLLMPPGTFTYSKF